MEIKILECNSGAELEKVAREHGRDGYILHAPYQKVIGEGEGQKLLLCITAFKYEDGENPIDNQTAKSIMDRIMAGEEPAAVAEEVTDLTEEETNSQGEPAAASPAGDPAAAAADAAVNPAAEKSDPYAGVPIDQRPKEYDENGRRIHRDENGDIIK